MGFRQLRFTRLTRVNVQLAALLALTWISSDAHAYINQVDGTVVPEATRLQQCLDLSEGVGGAVDAISEAEVLPETFRPVLDAGSGRYRVTFTDIGEGAGFRNSFGWFWADEDVTDPANLNTIFGCRTYGTCDCPCATTRTITIDFDLEPGFAVGRPIGFWLRTPERLDGSRENGTFPSGCPFDVGCDPTGTNINDSCGGRLDTNNRIYFTSSALNDDGDYVHFLVYESANLTDTFYFGFEDLFRGGDNDFEDMLVRATGLVPLCVLMPETCDGTDQDCDGAIDEGLTQACSTACEAGIRTCTAGSFGACSARVPDPTETMCDNLDDDCDGSIDEGLTRACSNMCGSGTEVCTAGSFADCSAPTPTIETCDGTDEDCDGMTDESLTRACVSTCGSGIETCSGGTFGGCTAPTPGTETCDNTDEDCDGLTDEGPITMPCSTACGSGISTCIAGAFVGCTAPTPTIETCDGTDEDCDGMIDEGIMRACSTACGPGTETCEDGAFVGCDAPTPEVEVCNNLDDDCNGIIDDGNPMGGAECIPDGMGGFIVDPPAGDDRCTPGRVVCVAGELVCGGATSPTRETCNCMDDDCDGEIDEDPDGTFCPGGACVDCQCLSPCRPGEFPCPPGKECDRSMGEPGFCVDGMCAGVECSDEEICDPDNGECRNLCDGVSCRDGDTCVRGRCVEDSCYGRGCEAGERCVDAVCEPDPCLEAMCAEGEFCRDGDCIAVCDEPCAAGELCVDGSCQADPCAGECTENESCIDGTCVTNACDPMCGDGRVCTGTECVHNVCTNIRCPDGTTCRQDGQCVTDDLVIPTEPRYGIAAGGGGCACDATGNDSRPVAWGLALLFLIALRRRPRATGVAKQAGLLGVIIVSLGNTGCDVEPFCFNCEDGAVDAMPDAGVDAMPADGCRPTGDELCNGIDDDCDGLFDETFDILTDPRHCGECDAECILPNAFPACMDGNCVIEECEIGHVDIDGNPINGCEYECEATGPEICDEVDNDCDGPSDEGFDLDTDLANCGECGNTCTFANADATCSEGTCMIGDCNAGFVDLNGDPDDGCEYRCSGSGGAEVCNSIDDNCDGTVDEGFDLNGDVNNCGACGRTCAFSNAVPTCDTGICMIGSCMAGFVDLDGDPATGCEYACTPTGGIDDCNGADDDCDGAVDESDPVVGTPCGTETGACTRGVNSCQLGAIACVGGIGGITETCNNVDDDCDGSTDEGSLAGVGDRCGATNVGVCEFGMLACSSGSLVCGGTLVEPGTETCNGLDDDCNGATDDAVTPPPIGTIPSCADTDGVCAGRTPTCRGAAGWECDLPADFQTIETLCDTLDNDCDGTDDEGCLSPTGSDRRLDTHVAASAENSLSPAIAGDGGNRIFTAWMEVSGAAHVYFARSTNGGSSFAAPVLLDSAGGPAIGPQLGFAGSDDVSAAWSDFRGGTNFREIYSNFSDNFGGGFAGNVKVNATGETASNDSFGVDMAVSGDDVYVVFEAFETERRRQVYFSRSADRGQTWTTPFQLSTPVTTTFVAATPRIAAAGSNVYVVWRDNRNGGLDIYLRRSSNRGGTWQAEQRIDVGDALGSNGSTAPAVAAEGGNVYVTWVDDRDAGSLDIWFNRSTNSGATFLGSAVQLDQDPFPHDSIEPQVVTTLAGELVVAWVDLRSGAADILATRSDDAGATFSAPVRLDTGTAAGVSASGELALSADGNLVAAAWSDDRAGMLDVYANFSLDGGANWQPQDYRMDTNGLGVSDSQDPRVLAVDGATPRIHVIWVDHRDGGSCPAPDLMSCANGDIYYRRMQ